MLSLAKRQEKRGKVQPISEIQRRHIEAVDIRFYYPRRIIVPYILYAIRQH
jgi:hypothetical protein